MNMPMVKQLILKDWYFSKNILAMYSVLGICALVCLLSTNGLLFQIGAILMVTVASGSGAHLVMKTLVQERKDKTLAFTVSLPITFMEYTTAKIISNLSVYIIPWFLMFFVAIYTVNNNPAMVAKGMMPFVIIILLEMFIVYAVLFTVAILSESEAWTIGASAIATTSFTLVIVGLMKTPDIGEHMQASAAVWNSTAIQIIVFEIAAIIILFAATFYIQSKKREFL